MVSLIPTARDAIQYWERRRLIYNAVLTCIVAAGFVLALPSSLSWLSRPEFFLGAAVMANVVCCAAYPVEWLFHLSPYREAWRRRRVALFVAGVLLASLLTTVIVAVVALGPLDNH